MPEFLAARDAKALQAGAAHQQQLIYTPHKHVSCNVHYARYRWRDGACEAGECEGESLIAVPISVAADGCIRIAQNTAHD